MSAWKHSGFASIGRWSALVACAVTLVLCHSPIAVAAPIALDDDQAVVISSDGKLYPLGLSDASLGAALDLTVAVPGSPVGALEANPTSDLLWALSQAAQPALVEIAAQTGVGATIEDGYQKDVVLDGLAIAPDGTVYVSYLPSGESDWHVGELELSTGVISSAQPTMLGATNKRMLSLVWSGDTLYGLAFAEQDALYSINPATGVVVLERAATGLAGISIVSADSTAEGTIYLLGIDDGLAGYLYTTDPTGGTIAIGEGLDPGEGISIEALAIATLLDSERSEPEPEQQEESQSRRSTGDSSPDPVLTEPVVAQNELAPTGAVAEVGYLIFALALVAAGWMALSSGRGRGAWSEHPTK